eukprot:g4511.t1
MSNERSEFLCPISMAIMEDPVILAETGISYERREITAWFSQGNSTCPCTGVKLQRRELIPNRALKDAIANWNTQESNSVSPLAAAVPSSRKRTRRLKTKWITNCFKINNNEVNNNAALIPRGVKPTSKDAATQITQSVHSSDLEALLNFFERGWNFNVLDMCGRGPLHVAVIDANHSMVTQLIQNFETQVNLGDRSGCTGLHWAARLGHYAIARSLVIGFKADVNSRNLMQMTPLHMAAYWGKREIVELLIQNGAEVEARNSKRERAIDVARSSPWEAAKEVVSLLESDKHY